MAFHTFQTIIVPGLIALVVTYISTRFLKTYLFSSGIVADDHNKEKPVILPSSGGLAVAFGTIVGLLAYVFGANFVFVSVLTPTGLLQLMAVGLSILMISMVGFLDDIHVKAEKVKTTDLMSIRAGLKQWQKPLLTFIGALPLMAVNAGISTVTVPFLGTLSIGILYPLLVLPLAIIFVSNAFNLIGGFDGLQTYPIAIGSLALLLYSVFYGNYAGTLLSALLFAAILATIPFFKYRAQIIPGDSYTYAIGATFVAIAVMGNAEAFGVVVFMPWIIEFILHLRRRFKVSTLGKKQPDGTFAAPYGKKIYSWTHLFMNMKKVKEPEVGYYFALVELLFVILAFGLKFAGLL